MKKDDITIVASSSQKVTLNMSSNTMNWTRMDLLGEDRTILLVDNVPSLHPSLMTSCEDD